MIVAPHKVFPDLHTPAPTMATAMTTTTQHHSRFYARLLFATMIVALLQTQSVSALRSPFQERSGVSVGRASSSCDADLHHTVEGSDSFQVLDPVDWEGTYVFQAGVGAMRGRLLFVPRVAHSSSTAYPVSISVYARPVGSVKYNADPVNVLYIPRKYTGGAVAGGPTHVSAWDQHLAVADYGFVHFFIRSGVDLDSRGYATGDLYTHTESLEIVLAEDSAGGFISGLDMVANTAVLSLSTSRTLVYLFDAQTGAWSWDDTVAADCALASGFTFSNTSDATSLVASQLIATLEPRASTDVTKVSQRSHVTTSLFAVVPMPHSQNATDPAEPEDFSSFVARAMRPSDPDFDGSLIFYTLSMPVQRTNGSSASSSSPLEATLVERQVIQASSTVASIATDPIYGRVALGMPSVNQVDIYTPDCSADPSVCYYSRTQILSSTSDDFGYSVAFTADTGALVVGTYSDTNTANVEAACAELLGDDPSATDEAACLAAPVGTLFVFQDDSSRSLSSPRRLTLVDQYSVADPAYDWPVGLSLVADKSPFAAGDLVMTPFPSQSVAPGNGSDGKMASVAVPMSDSASTTTLCDTDGRFCSRQTYTCTAQGTTPTCTSDVVATAYLTENFCDEAIGAYTTA